MAGRARAASEDRQEFSQAQKIMTERMSAQFDELKQRRDAGAEAIIAAHRFEEATLRLADAAGRLGEVMSMSRKDIASLIGTDMKTMRFVDAEKDALERTGQKQQDADTPPDGQGQQAAQGADRTAPGQAWQTPDNQNRDPASIS